MCLKATLPVGGWPTGAPSLAQLQRAFEGVEFDANPREPGETFTRAE